MSTEALAQPQQEPYTYASTQSTMCARCGEHKHTPLRIDSMGGYVCLTCIDQQLGSLLGEFGYPEPEQPAQEIVCSTGLCYYRKPLTDEQIVAKALHLSGLGTSPDVIQFARAIESAHGIKGDA